MKIENTRRKIIGPNPNEERYKEVSKAVKENEGYCCCALVKEDDTMCMCKEFRDTQKTGLCHCERFYKAFKPKVITLCGSTRFKKQFEEINKELTLQGFVVLAPGCFGHDDIDPRIEEEKENLDDLHRNKIFMSDAIFVINVGGYIGSSTYSEIEWAETLGKEIYYLEEKE